MQFWMEHTRQVLGPLTGAVIVSSFFLYKIAELRGGPYLGVGGLNVGKRGGRFLFGGPVELACDACPDSSTR